MTPEVKSRIEQIRHGNVPEGYLKDKDGVHPSDWSVKKMGQWLKLAERPITLEDDETYQLVTVRRGFGGVDSRGYFLGKNVLVKNYFSVNTEDFIISKRQIAHGACGVVPEELNGAAVSNEYNVFIPQEGTNIRMFNLMMQLPHYKRLFYLMSDGVHIEKLLFKTQDWMRRSLAMPPLEEQKKIAEILTMQDKVIELKEKRLAEKQRQKKYLMQQLLTGKKRLPGFDGEWEVHTLDMHLSESRLCGSNGATAKKLTVKLWNKGVVEKKELHIGSENTTYYRRLAGQFIYSKLDFLNCAFGIIPNELDGCESTQDLPCFDIENINPKFLLYYVTQESFYKRFGALANGGRKAKRVNPDDLLKFHIIYPSLDEQSMIVDILSTADKEIALLCHDLEQEKQKKKALMQLLLTGVVRL